MPPFYHLSHKIGSTQPHPHGNNICGIREIRRTVQCNRYETYNRHENCQQGKERDILGKTATTSTCHIYPKQHKSHTCHNHLGIEAWQECKLKREEIQTGQYDQKQRGYNFQHTLPFIYASLLFISIIFTEKQATHEKATSNHRCETSGSHHNEDECSTGLPNTHTQNSYSCNHYKQQSLDEVYK